MDFVTIFFNDESEINLLRLQAMSMKFVNKTIIHNIYVIYNSPGLFDINEIIDYYPNELKPKVKLIYNEEIDHSFKNTKSSWYNQQILKILISKIAESDYYLIMDGKNHFIRGVNYSDYFDKSGKPFLFLGYPGNMINNYYNCLEYYESNCPFDYKNKENQIKLLTTTPFLLKKKDVLEMINYVEEKENLGFYDFFCKNPKKITEFYLYSTYLICKNKLEDYSIKQANFCSIMGNIDPAWNSYENIGIKALNNELIKIFALHRGALKNMDNDYKVKLMGFYPNFYDEFMCEFIKKRLLNL
uniref:DUF5672 domain-containing protein n=1 Tax=viral metagenome TaxID=1070528 RepID=A0A6C0JH35_9ZZZZ